jgi:hypothetical protein
MAKYICFDTGLFEDAVVFSDSVKHSDMANALGLRTEQILSAGFVTFATDSDCNVVIHPYGVSVSLSTKTNDKSQKILQRALDTGSDY